MQSERDPTTTDDGDAPDKDEEDDDDDDEAAQVSLTAKLNNQTLSFS